MTAWLDALRGLLVFRRGPADVPHAPWALVMLFVAMIAIEAFAEQLLSGRSGDRVLGVLINGFALLLIYGLLSLFDKRARFVQTATALLAIRIALSLVTLALLAGVAPLPQKPEELRPEQALLISLLLPVFIWYLGLRTHVLRQALDVTIARAFGLVLMIAAIEVIIGVSIAQALQ